MKIQFDNTLWYSPYILFDWISEVRKQLNIGYTVPKDLDKLLKELYLFLWFLPGIGIITGKIYYIQLVNPEEQTPDIKTMYEVFDSEGRLRRKEIQNVEIVRYENHAGVKFSDFVINTKFNCRKKSYDSNTIFLFIIDNDISPLIDIREAHNKINATQKQNETYVVQRATVDKKMNDSYNICRISPDFSKTLNYVALSQLKKTFPLYEDHVIMSCRAGVIPSPNQEVSNPFLEYLHK